MFDDTQTPVCLALFVKENTNDFEIYSNDFFVGNYNQLKKHIRYAKRQWDWKFNDNKGQIGLICIDNTKGDSIQFLKAQEITKDVSNSSRSFTKISMTELKNEAQINDFIVYLNQYIKEYRQMTYDVFLTSFKGLRADGKYRRRISFKEARRILNYYEKWIKQNNNKKTYELDFFNPKQLEINLNKYS